MKKQIVLIVTILLSCSVSFASDFGCSRSENKDNSMYLWDKIVNFTNSSDKLKCKKRLDKMTINTLDGNDEINTLKSDNNGTVINLWNWNDIFDQNVDKWVLANITINGWNGYDKLIINKKKDRLVIDGNCADFCKVYIKDSNGNPWRKFKNVTLKSIEEIQTKDWVIKFDWNNHSENNSNQNNNTQWNNPNYQKIDLSSYKYLIPAYFWSEDLNKKLLKLPTKSYYYYSKSFKWWFFKIWNYFSGYDK